MDYKEETAIAVTFGPGPGDRLCLTLVLAVAVPVLMSQLAVRAGPVT